MLRMPAAVLSIIGFERASVIFVGLVWGLDSRAIGFGVGLAQLVGVPAGSNVLVI